MINLDILHIKDQCTGCFACYNICPVQALQMDEDYEGFYYPVVDPDKCIECRACEKKCPVLNLKSRNRDEFKAYYGYSKDNVILKNSSSGGAFNTFASKILNQQGCVYGASFNYSTLRLEHTSTDRVSLKKLQKSKYVQSYVGNAYKEVKKQLVDGKMVLFVGTPCQIDGLSSYLGEDFLNLFTCDFICHGVPPMDLLRKHLEYVGFNLNEVIEIDFRPKIIDWVDYLIVNGKKNSYKRFYRYDAFFNAFQQYLNLRRSCYSCRYCNGQNRKADITFADFWGISKTNIAISRENGISLILGNTPKGVQLIEQLREDKSLFNVYDLDQDKASYVYSIDRLHSNKYDFDRRNHFFASIIDNGYKKSLKKWGLNYSVRDWIYFDIKQYIKRLYK